MAEYEGSSDAQADFEQASIDHSDSSGNVSGDNSPDVSVDSGTDVPQG